MWLTVAIVAVVVLAGVVALAILYGARRWGSEMDELREEMEAALVPLALPTVDPRHLEGLPAPVERYFQTVLKAGQPMIAAASLEHTGTFNMSQTGEGWKPFRSAQRVVTRRPGFVWDARIHMAPGMTVNVRDAYVAGQGILTAKLFGLLTVVDQPGTPELAQGELMRFFAEATWYPTALLPGQGLAWEAVDDTHARVTLADGASAVTLVFEFDSQGLISSVHSEGRYRDVDGEPVATPWQGRFWDYQERHGVLIPLEGEVAWLLPEGPHPYWRGRIQRIEYEYVP